MGQQVKEVMTTGPITLDRDASLAEAARVMRDRGIGDVIVVEGDDAEGIVTDRDIVIRGVRRGCRSEHDTAGTGRERRPDVGRPRRPGGEGARADAREGRSSSSRPRRRQARRRRLPRRSRHPEGRRFRARRHQQRARRSIGAPEIPDVPRVPRAVPCELWNRTPRMPAGGGHAWMSNRLARKSIRRKHRRANDCSPSWMTP